MRCNAGSRAATSKCPVKAGDTITVEMHQQNGDRSCSNEAIGGAHYGPVMVYMSKVANAATADGSAGWFKVYQDSWAKAPSSRLGDDDYWGVKDMNKCCGKVNVKVPSDIPAGDYLVRAEVVALHSAGGSGGAQFYMSCYQVTVSGGGSASPALVLFPGAYRTTDPGILVNIHSPLTSYTAPGPAVYSGGTTKTAGAGCVGCEATCAVGMGPKTTLSVIAPEPSSGTGGGGGSGGCAAAAWVQCGGTGFSGCTACPSGYKCVANNDYYSQCQTA